MPTYDPHTALVVVDLQNDFADPAGGLAVTDGAAIVPFVNAQVLAAGSAGALVVYTQDWHPEHTPHFAADGGTWPSHCVQDTWGARLHPDLLVAGPVVRKGANGEDGYSGFTMRDALTGATVATDLDWLLREAGVTSVVVCGLATDYCVRATVLDALERGFRTSVLAEGIRAVDLQAGDGERAIREVVAAGATIEPAGEG
jgi:nicotinamidase/pyrazinamidase